MKTQKEVIDCLLIGYNQMGFEEYEENVRKMGYQHGAYRDLRLNYLKYNHQLYTFTGAFNSRLLNPKASDPAFRPFSLGDLFNLTIAYLGTYLKRRNFAIDQINFFQSQKEELAEKLTTKSIRSVAITTTYYVTIFPILEIISFIREYDKDVVIIVGGPFIATQLKNEDETTVQFLFKSMGADIYVNSSQGEETLAKIMKALVEGTSFEQIPNIAYRVGEGYLLNSVEPEDNVLAENPVDWSLFSEHLGRITAIRTSISCPFSCSFCGFPEHAGKYQTVCVECIEQELDQLQESGRVQSILFIDDTLNIPQERFKEMLRMMIRKQYSFKWHCNFRCQFADREMVELMKESGCEGVFLGIESGSEQILKNMHKAATVEQYRRGIALLKEAGIPAYASFIIGFPGETLETVQETIRFIEETRPDYFRTQLWYGEPITPIYREKEKYRIRGAQFDWSHATMDAGTACDLIDTIFLTVKNSIWVPQYNFEFFGIFHLLQKGYRLDQVNEMLIAFRDGIAEKLQHPEQRELSSEGVLRLRKAFGGDAGDCSADQQKIPKLADQLEADFDF